MTVCKFVTGASAAVIATALATGPAMAHHKAGHTANCGQHTLSPYCDVAGQDDVTISAVPVPASLLMLGSAFGLVGACTAYCRRKA